jgi:GNAT superfamily N-acetyltransferase
MDLRSMALGELARVREIDVSEDGSTVYTVVDGQLTLTEETWQRSPRSASQWQPYIEEWEALLPGRGAALGAFAEGRLVGIAVMRYRLTVGRAQLVALFVDRAHRRQGIATTLTDEVLRRARRAGAQDLYVSATPSESAVGFYTRQGFTLAQPINPELFEREPEDIHLIRSLSRRRRRRVSA